MISIPLYLSAEHPCSYIDGNIARSAFVHPDFTLDTTYYTHLAEKGFRRSGNHVYAPCCKTCSACIPVRVPAAQFEPSRKQKRVIKKHQTTVTHIKPAVFDNDHYKLYLKYQHSRHQGSGMAESTPEQYINFLSSDWCHTWFVEFLIKEQLIAVAIVDKLDNAFSAVYTFFDPDYSAYSPGVFAILWQIQQARQHRLKWLYLGFWIEQCAKMSYKTQYRPCQLYIDRQWQ